MFKGTVTERPTPLHLSAIALRCRTAIGCNISRNTVAIFVCTGASRIQGWGSFGNPSRGIVSYHLMDSTASLNAPVGCPLPGARLVRMDLQQGHHGGCMFWVASRRRN